MSAVYAAVGCIDGRRKTDIQHSAWTVGVLYLFGTSVLKLVLCQSKLQCK